jgi:hypothetical protein
MKREDLKYLNIVIERYDLDLIKSNANTYLAQTPDSTPTKAWVVSVMDYLFKNGILNRDLVKLYNEQGGSND